MWYLHLRESLAPELAEGSSGQIDRALGPDLADELESLAGVVQSVAPLVAKAAPSALKGAATGFMLGGPAGALAGGVAGGLAGSGALPGVNQAVPVGAAPSRGPIANPAALQLLLTLLRPEVVEALIAMVLGRNGSRGVDISGQPVPVAAVSNLIQSLAEAASATHHAIQPRGGVPRYLSEARRRGEDISTPAVRTAALLELVHDAWDDDLPQADADFEDELDAEDLYPGELNP